MESGVVNVGESEIVRDGNHELGRRERGKRATCIRDGGSWRPGMSLLKFGQDLIGSGGERRSPTLLSS
jgi:hypothetical protein